MAERKESYTNSKRMTQQGQVKDIALVDSHSEIWELDDKQKAEEIADILTKNSDSGWTYYVRTAK